MAGAVRTGRRGEQPADGVRGEAVGGAQVVRAARRAHPAERPEAQREHFAHYGLHIWVVAERVRREAPVRSGRRARPQHVRAFGTQCGDRSSVLCDHQRPLSEAHRHARSRAETRSHNRRSMRLQWSRSWWPRLERAGWTVNTATLNSVIDWVKYWRKGAPLLNELLEARRIGGDHLVRVFEAYLPPQRAERRSHSTWIALHELPVTRIELIGTSPDRGSSRRRTRCGRRSGRTRSRRAARRCVRTPRADAACSRSQKRSERPLRIEKRVRSAPEEHSVAVERDAASASRASALAHELQRALCVGGHLVQPALRAPLLDRCRVHLHAHACHLWSRWKRDGGGDMSRVWALSTSAMRQMQPAMVAALACAPLMPPRPLLTNTRPASSHPAAAPRRLRAAFIMVILHVEENVWCWYEPILHMIWATSGAANSGAVDDALRPDVAEAARRHLAVERHAESEQPVVLRAARVVGHHLPSARGGGQRCQCSGRVARRKRKGCARAPFRWWRRRAARAGRSGRGPAGGRCTRRASAPRPCRSGTPSPARTAPQMHSMCTECTHREQVER